MKKKGKKKNKIVLVGLILFAVFVLCVGGYFFIIGKDSNYHFGSSSKEEKEEGNSLSFEKEVSLDDEKTISFSLPKDWTYEKRTIEDDTILSEIYLFPEEGNKEKYLVIQQAVSLGVCGTFLTTQEMELNNHQYATVGYYDGKQEEWDFVIINNERKIFSYPVGFDKEDYAKALEVIKTVKLENAS